MPTHKVFLAGLRGAGKTEAIKAMSDLPLVSVVKKIPALNVEVELDYGRVHRGRHMVYLYAATHRSEVLKFWLSLRSEMTGLLYLFDGSKDSCSDGLAELSAMRAGWAGSTIVGVNGINRTDYREDVYERIVVGVGSDVDVLPVSVLRRESAIELIDGLLRRMHNKERS